MVWGPKSFRQPKPPFDGAGGLFPNKPSGYGITGVMHDFMLIECEKAQCRMKVPGEEYHVLVVSNETGKIRAGQRKVDGRGKAAIPKGVHDKIWQSHLEWIATEDGHSYECAVCGGLGLLTCCDKEGCNSAQHVRCSKMDMKAEPWYCNVCALEEGCI